MKVKKAISLLEVMIAMSLLILATSALGWKMHGMIAKKRFSSSVERCKSRLFTCRRLALNMQEDWECVFVSKNGKVFLESYCADCRRTSPLPSLSIGKFDFFLNGEKIEKICFRFTATGDMLPHGHLQIRQDKDGVVNWELPDLFSLEEGKL